MNILLSRLTTGLEAVYVLLSCTLLVHFVSIFFIRMDLTFICPPPFYFRQFKVIIYHVDDATILISDVIYAFVTNVVDMSLVFFVCLFYELTLGLSLLPRQIIFIIVNFCLYGEGLVEPAKPSLLHSLIEAEFQSFLVRLLKDVKID